MKVSPIAQSVRAYDRWLASWLDNAFVRADLREKHAKMASGAFPFLRATYWRWCEIVLSVCPHFKNAPRTLCVGDIHLENFGTWRDADGRLVWGVNDFDEAASMPFALDLVRLAASALLAQKQGPAEKRRVCAAILFGYEAGLRAPAPFILDKDNGWLRRLVEVGSKKRAAFWAKLPTTIEKRVPPHFHAALAAAMPMRDCEFRVSRRTAGAGSLGRLRLIGIADWRGAPLVREAKALAPSGWTLAHARTLPRKLDAPHRAATGAFRAPDPWMAWRDNIVVRRLSPNNRKIEAQYELDILLLPNMLEAMGHELASIHVSEGKGAAIRDYLLNLPEEWLSDAAEAMAGAVKADFKAFTR